MSEQGLENQGQEEQVTDAVEVSDAVVKATALSDWCALESLLYEMPTVEFIGNLTSASVGDDVRQIAIELGRYSDEIEQIAIGFDGLRDQLAADENALHTVRIEHTRVFMHPKHPVIWPYEGVFVDSELAAQGLKTSEARLFVNPSAMDAQRRYKAHGYRLASQKQPEDHISVELGFMSRMYASVAEAELAGDVAKADALRADLADFKAARIDTWLRRFFERCIEDCRNDLYVLAGRSGLQLLDALE